MTKIGHHKKLIKLRNELFKKDGASIEDPPYSNGCEWYENKLMTYVKDKCKETYHYLMKNDIGVWHYCLSDGLEDNAKELSEGFKEKGTMDENGEYFCKY